jgi:phosphoglycolate phosphatase
VVFDLDGTLVDSVRDIAAAVNDALGARPAGRVPLPLDVVQAFVGDGPIRLMERSIEAAGSSLSVEEALPLYLEAYRRRMLDDTPFYPGTLEALDALRGAGATLAVLTNKQGDLSRELLAGLGQAGRFARIWGGGDLPGHKPDPVGLVRLMQELGFPRERTVMVGDSAVDVATGRAAGVATVGVSFGLDPSRMAAAGPDLVIDDLRHLPPWLRARAGA